MVYELYALNCCKSWSQLNLVDGVKNVICIPNIVLLNLCYFMPDFSNAYFKNGQFVLVFEEHLFSPS